MAVTGSVAVSVEPGFDGVDLVAWRDGFEELFAGLAGLFGRPEPRRTARSMLLGLLSTVERKNCWWLAEQAAAPSPDAMQRLLSSAVWGAEAACSQLRCYVVEHLGHPDAVLVIDETGYLKKGRSSVGVQRQYTGTAGKIENCQIGVFLIYASPLGRAMIDRRLYLPNSWTSDPDRCAGAGVPAGVRFATKPQLARQMLAAALDAAVPASWVAGDEVYGADPHLRADLEARRVGYVLAVACDHQVALKTGAVRVDAVAAALPSRSWQRLSAGAGAKGPRLYDWAWIRLPSPLDSRHRWLLIRRNIATGELAFYRAHAPAPVPLSALVRVAGARWAIEEDVQVGKDQFGLDHSQVRLYTALLRHLVLTMIALAACAVAAAATRPVTNTLAPPPTHPDDEPPADPGLIPLTVAEIKRLANLVTRTGCALSHHLRWSWWRRRHQARARWFHHRTRLRRGLQPAQT